MRNFHIILKLSPVLCLSILFGLLTSFGNSVLSIIACPDTLKWSPVNTPDERDNVIVSPSELNAIAVGNDGETFYVLDIPNSKVFKSTDGGYTWIELSSQLVTAGAVLPAWNVALAPDNPNTVAVVTSKDGLPREVFASVDGGLTWWDTNCRASANIGAIAISPYYGTYDIATGTRTSTGKGDVYILNINVKGHWKDQGLGKDVLNIRFSPNYRADFAIAIVSASDNGTYLDLGIRHPVANTTNWRIWGPVEITTSGVGTSPKVNQVVTADLELPADFLGQTANLRQFYISIDAPGANGGIFRFDDTVGHLLMPANLNLRISSISYFGICNSGKLIAGEVLANHSTAAVNIWLTDNPTTCSGHCWYRAEKAPTGGGNSGYGNAQVAWRTDGKQAYCVTSSAQLTNPTSWPMGYLNSIPLDESAFSSTSNNGQTWNQLSLIDTKISFLSDVAVTLMSDTIFLASINSQDGINSFDSIWRTVDHAMHWERILCALSTTDDLLLRLDQNSNNAGIYVASCSTNELKESLDGGETWTNISPGVSITDFAVVEFNGKTQAYILGDNYVRSGIRTAAQPWQWSPLISTTLNSGHNIFAAACGIIVVGDNYEGMAAYSLDGGNRFIHATPIPTPGKIHVTADCRFRNAVIIYAASDSPNSDLYSWVIGKSTEWSNMGAPGQSFYGLSQMNTLYGACLHGNITAVVRTVEPERLTAPYVAWDCLTVGLLDDVKFTREPTSLKISAGNNLWAIDNRPYTSTTGKLWTFYDCLSQSISIRHPTTKTPSREMLFQAPVPVAPVKEEVIPVYLETRTIGDIILRWKHPISALEYEIWIAEDESFTKTIIRQTVKQDDYRIMEWLIPKSVGLQSGTTYYWKVRVAQSATGERDNGDWSETMSFSIASFPPEAQKSELMHQETPQDVTVHDTSSTVLAFLPWWAWTALVCFLLVAIAIGSISIVQRQRWFNQKKMV